MKFIQSYLLILALMMGTALISQAQTTTPDHEIEIVEEDTDPVHKAEVEAQRRDAQDVTRTFQAEDPSGNTATTTANTPRESFQETLDPGNEDAQLKADLEERKRDHEKVELPSEVLHGQAHPIEADGFEAKNDHDPVHSTNYDAQKEAHDEHFQVVKPSTPSNGPEVRAEATKSTTLKRANFTPDPSEVRPTNGQSPTLKRATTEQRDNSVEEDKKKN